jgi:hypothetical protein
MPRAMRLRSAGKFMSLSQIGLNKEGYLVIYYSNGKNPIIVFLSWLLAMLGIGVVTLAPMGKNLVDLGLKITHLMRKAYGLVG